MPQAVVHVLFTIILIDLFRDYVIKDKKKIPLHYVFIGGIAGLLPDIDIPLSWLINDIFGASIPVVHRTFTHTLFFPLILLGAALIFLKFDKKKSILMGVITFGVFFHLVLDMIFAGYVMPFYPLSYNLVGLDLVGKIGLPSLIQGLEAIVLLGWLWHEEKKHKISDFF